ncbi:ATP-sensitive inward rectifier potassium channel 15 [Phyllopteryx taeniolatus]|uniref:ATP-sensitive inward rectifier potassium channel 15 n=1 Tax=Phyllopteryx taeniolatus TaxID=161469 RepID=UPI002AD4E036|nr:ATP-sensitive inward rectifier potassium channel 15 [Phyllopteryx taeniolatus]XP_061607752.1 ATP-sensitive inward rectifier potassium channel 15 [Phyllopteryx taeniolatus]
MVVKKAEVRRRIVSKDGHNNVRIDNVEGMVKLYLHDIWTTVVDIKWRYKLTLFASTFILTWFLFGVFFYLISLGNGDFETNLSSNHTPCLENVKTFTGAFLFSLESQTTIGYGFRYITEDCPLAIFTLVAQLVITGLAEIFVTGAFLAKLARPKKRAETIKFSQCAVVCRRQGQLCLMVRVANMRKSLLIQCQLTGKLLHTNVTQEGEKTQVHQTSVDFFMDSSRECSFLILPLTFYHILDEHSPLAGLSAENLRSWDMELLVTLNATMESTAATCQSRTSYIPNEILWGYEFKPVIFSTAGGRYVADFNFFNKVQVSNDAAFLDNAEKLKLEDDYKKE